MAFVGDATLRELPLLERALAECFDAIAHPAGWGTAMNGLASALGGLGCCFNPIGSENRRRLAPISDRYADMLAEFRADEWAPLDLRLQRGWPKVRAGQLLVSEAEITTAEERLRAPIYAELFSRHDLSIFAGAALHASDQSWAFNIVRNEKAGVFSGQEMKRLGFAWPHLMQLIDLSGKISAATATGALTGLALNGTPAALLDAQGRVTQMNLPGEALMGTGIGLRRGRLTVSDYGSHKRLEALTAAVLSDDHGRCGPVLEPIILSRPDRRPLIAKAVPLRENLADAFGYQRALLLFSDTEERRAPDRSLLAQAFGLTSREADVAAMIASGKSPAAIAEDLALRISSVRQLIKSILAKTDTRRQGELVALFSRVISRQAKEKA